MVHQRAAGALPRGTQCAHASHRIPVRPPSIVMVQRAPVDTVAFHILQTGKRTTVHAPSMRSDVVGAKSKGRLKSVPHNPGPSDGGGLQGESELAFTVSEAEGGV